MALDLELALSACDLADRLTLSAFRRPTLAVETKPEDAALLGKLMLVASKLAAEAGFAASGFRVVANAGPDAGQSVPHVHLHALAGRSLGWPPG